MHTWLYKLNTYINENLSMFIKFTEYNRIWLVLVRSSTAIITFAMSCYGVLIRSSTAIITLTMSCYAVLIRSSTTIIAFAMSCYEVQNCKICHYPPLYFYQFITELHYDYLNLCLNVIFPLCWRCRWGENYSVEFCWSFIVVRGGQLNGGSS